MKIIEGSALRRLRKLQNEQKKISLTINNLRKLWVSAIDRAFVERHIAANAGRLTQIETEIQSLEQQQIGRE